MEEILCFLKLGLLKKMLDGRCCKVLMLITWWVLSFQPSVLNKVRTLRVNQISPLDFVYVAFVSQESTIPEGLEKVRVSGT